MGNLIGYTADKTDMVRGMALQFIEDHKDVWEFVLDRVRIGRQLKCQSYLDEANAVYAPLIEAEGYGIGGEIEVARELWRLMRMATMPKRKPEDAIIDEEPL